MDLDLHARTTPGAFAERLTSLDLWRMTIPAGPASAYRWAQFDDYMHHARRDFAWQAPFILQLEARVSSNDLPGTWGFGFWNDPFNASLGIGGTSRRLPALPNTAWFFYGSAQNWLSFRDDRPANGLLASTFRSPLIHSLLLAPALLGLPLALWPPTARLLRRLAGKIIRGDAARLQIDACAWHTYRLAVSPDEAAFYLDGQACLRTPFRPLGRLALVIWIDNQYAAFTPQGKLAFGSQVSLQPAWLEVRQVTVNS